MNDDASERETMPPRMSTDPPESLASVADVLANAPPWAALLYRQSDDLIRRLAEAVAERDRTVIETISALAERFDTNFTAIEKQLRDVRTDMALIRTEVQNTRQDIARHSLTLMKLEERVGRVESDVRDAQRAISQLEIRDRDLGGQLRAFQEQMDQQLSDLKTQIDDLRGDIQGTHAERSEAAPGPRAKP